MNKKTHKPRATPHVSRIEKLAWSFFMYGTGVNQHPEIWESEAFAEGLRCNSQISGCWLITVPVMRKCRYQRKCTHVSKKFLFRIQKLKNTNNIEASRRAAKSVVSSSGRRKVHIPGNLAKYLFIKDVNNLILIVHNIFTNLLVFFIIPWPQLWMNRKVIFFLFVKITVKMYLVK